MKVFHSIRSLVKEGRKLAEKSDVISFDLFDTLLIRRIHDPDLVKLPVARYIAQRASEFGLNYSFEHVQSVRDNIEQQQRQETGKKYKDYEACYPIFMRDTLKKLFREHMSDELLQEVTAWEMKMENAVLVPRQELVDWLIELHGQKKMILVVSDVYLRSDFLRGLLKHGGIEPYVDHVYSSADFFLGKASGEAFHFLQNKYDLQPERWIHIGDNRISDGVRPTDFGITALVLDDPAEKQRKHIIKKQLNYSQGRPFWRGRVLQQLMLPLEAENTPQEPLYVEGYNFLGPLIGVFIKGVVKKCRENKIEKLFFLSREGYTFKKYWEQAAPYFYPTNDAPVIEYLYASRMALAGSSCAYQGLTKSNADLAFLAKGNKDFRDVCRIFSLDIDPLEVYLKKYDLGPTSILSPLHDGYLPENTSNYHVLLEDKDFQAEIKNQTLPSNDALQLYLEDLDFFDYSNIAFVDIGWLGTIPRLLVESIQHREHPVCHSFLFGATRGIEYASYTNKHINGLIYDKNRCDFGASCILYSRDLFEEACKAPHPTLNGYKLKDGGYELIFRHTDDDSGRAELEQDRYYAPLQKGIYDSAVRFSAASVLLGFSIDDYKPWLNYLLVEKMAFPKTGEIANIRHQHHLDDFHGTHKPLPAVLKGARRKLWDISLASLRWMPLVRLKFYLHHLRDRLNG